MPDHMKKEPVIIGGKRIEGDYYGNYQNEVNMINQAFCEIMMEGDAKGEHLLFPFHIQCHRKLLNLQSSIK